MDDLDPAATRDSHGRFIPGRSGNPAGKKPGTVHKATALKAALRDGEAEAAARVIIDKAVAGNVAAARFVLDRVDPKPRGRAVEFAVEDSGDVGQLLDAAVRAVANGEYSTDEALGLLRLIKGVRELRPRAAAEAPRPTSAPARPLEPAAPAFHLHPAGGTAPLGRSDLLSGVSRAAIAAGTRSPPHHRAA
jgi:hypothetical protein